VKEQFDHEAERIRTSGARYTECFWFAERTVLHDFPARGL